SLGAKDNFIGTKARLKQKGLEGDDIYVGVGKRVWKILRITWEKLQHNQLSFQEWWEDLCKNDKASNCKNKIGFSTSCYGSYEDSKQLAFLRKRSLRHLRRGTRKADRILNRLAICVVQGVRQQDTVTSATNSIPWVLLVQGKAVVKNREVVRWSPEFKQNFKGRYPSSNQEMAREKDCSWLGKGGSNSSR
ncbi:PF07614 family protein, partial [Striga asiatica]